MDQIDCRQAQGGPTFLTTFFPRILGQAALALIHRSGRPRTADPRVTPRPVGSAVRTGDRADRAVAGFMIKAMAGDLA